MGARTAPINNEPPTQIAADVRWIQVIIACSIAILNQSLTSNIIYLTLDKVFNCTVCQLNDLSQLQGKMILYTAIGGLLVIMGAIVYYASLDNPELERLEIKLVNVELLDVNSIENQAKLDITFLVKNPSDKTFTVAIISYELYANDRLIGIGQYSTEDVSMPGRAAFYPDSEIPLKNIFKLVLSDVNAQEYQSIIRGESVKYSVKGIITAETAWSLIEKEFQSYME